MVKSNVDPKEVNKFSTLAAHWWETEGDFKTLHEMNPIRVNYLLSRTSLDSTKKVLDIGCGGGILTESLAKTGATVTGIDMSKAALDVAKLHQIETGVSIEYIEMTAEQFALERPNYYDVITCLELLEHVPDPASIIQSCSKLIKPGGDIFFSTINRTAKAYLFAIVGAEYILKLLPKDTHDYAKFIKPSELTNWARENKLEVKDLTGVHYNPINHQFSLNKDVSVNYLSHFKPY